MVFGEPDIDLKNEGNNLRVAIKVSMCTTPPPAKSAPTPQTTSPAGSSTPTTTAKASSSATPTSLAKDQPYEKLKRALRAEIDEAAWASLYSTVSRPFS